jgi:RNA polymerase II subunit A-like phosphatase
MKISSPAGLRYPFTVSALDKPADAKVKRSDKLFAYWYEETVTESDKWGDEHQVQHKRVRQFDASTEGKLTRWFIKPGAVVERAG